MNFSFGTENPELTKAIKRIANGNSANVEFIAHAEDEMENDGFDHTDVLVALRRGYAYGPEIQNGRLRANVIHRGIHIRVVVGGLDSVGEDWSLLTKICVVTVMKAK